MQDRYGTTVSLALILTTTALSLVILHLAPDGAMVPVHFSRDWEADKFVRPHTGVVIWTGLQLGIWALMYTLPLLSRSGEGFRESRTVYDAAWVTLTALLCTVQIAAMEEAIGIKIAKISLVNVMMGFFLVVVGNGLGKIRPNELIGIRTPWTKASVRVWNRTHRTSAPIFILVGALLIASGFGILGIPSGSGFRIGCILISAALSCGLSWLYWRSEQKKS
ncbi:SdpI family protein [Acidomonas methanolica]|uniref:SdpI family protein n=1 Tax=Acidomonas methanolica TaxID=437 RepID=UPI00211A6D0F|nr:SdpI family protein [Acidomonas methanolica]MCQ9157131.1 SdpI family protein [Acidomonas methanolica]